MACWPRCNPWCDCVNDKCQPSPPAQRCPLACVAVRIVSLSVLALVLLLPSLVSSQSPTPSEPVKGTSPLSKIRQAPTAPGPLFSFERQNDPVSRALVAGYRSYLTAPTDQAEYDRNERALEEARRTLRANGSTATTILRRELSRLTPPIDHDRERSLLLWLLADVRTPEALATLGDVAITPRTREGFEGTPMIEQSVALAQLTRIAAAQDRVARDQILRVVARVESDPALRREAITAYYRVSPSRFRARREVTAVLPIAQRYLAHQTF
jgi:hypothetical protein